MTENTFDANGRVIQQKQADGGIIKISYTLANPLAPSSPVIQAVVIDPLGRSSIYRFSTSNYVSDSTDALGHARVFERSSANLVTAIKGDGDAAGCGNPAFGDTAFTYDSATGNVLSQEDTLSNKATSTYEPVFNNVITSTNPLGDVSGFTYDSRSNLTSQTDPNNHTTTYKYDDFGQLIETSDPINQTTKLTYDIFGNLTTITDASGKRTQYRYDAISRLVEVTDALGRSSLTNYDNLNRVIKRIDPNGEVTIFQYDGADNLLSLTDSKGHKTSFTYDGMSRPLTRTTALGTVESRTYDFVGNLTQSVDRRGQISKFVYDELNRLITEIHLDSTVVRAYDANGRLVSINDSASGVFNFSYDIAGQLLNSKTPFGTVLYTRDGLGRMKSRQVVGQDRISYSYDPAGNVTSLNSPAMGATFSYDGRNELLTLARANGVSTAYNYDPLGRVLSLIHAKGANVITSASYTYNAVGDRTSNINSSAQPLVTQAIGSAVYDAENEQNQFGPTVNIFDANGNVVSATDVGGTTTYTWDARNRLTAISAPNGQITRFTYDFAGNLIQQSDTGSFNLTQSFVLDDLTNVAYVNRTDGDQYSVLTGQSLDKHLAVAHASGQIEYGLADAINTTIMTVDQTGSIKGRLLYEPFGQTTAISTTYPFQYTGRVPVSSGLYYYRARFYSPIAGRFLSEDPIGFKGGLDSFSYALNRPTMATDPTGLAIWICTRKANLPFNGNHAYLWDDRSVNYHACGLDNPWGTMPPELGPGLDSCRPVPNSGGHEDSVMRCCRDQSSSTLWNLRHGTCHGWADHCLQGDGLLNPGGPGGWFGCRECNTPDKFQ